MDALVCLGSCDMRSVEASKTMQENSGGDGKLLVMAVNYWRRRQTASDVGKLFVVLVNCFGRGRGVTYGVLNFVWVRICKKWLIAKCMAKYLESIYFKIKPKEN